MKMAENDKRKLYIQGVAAVTFLYPLDVCCSKLRKLGQAVQDSSSTIHT